MLWLGLGDIARRCLPRLHSSGWRSVGMARSAAKAEWVDEFHASRLGEERAREVLAGSDFDAVVLSLSPDRHDLDGYRRCYLEGARALREIWPANPPFVLYVSSTSVYSQNAGEWIDEGSAAHPASDKAGILLAAEGEIAGLGPRHCVLRCSGIYGEGRHHLINQVRAGKGGDDSFTNRIHAEDCAALIYFLLQRVVAGNELPRLLLGSDSEPARSRDVRAWIAEHIDSGERHRVTMTPGDTGPGGKRINNALLRELGYRFIFPDYRCGYRDVLQKAGWWRE